MLLSSSPTPRLVLRSRINGRERWEVKELLGSPIRALSLQTLLATEPGMKRVEANPVTGRVLLEYQPCQLQESTKPMLLRALAFGPMSSEELGAMCHESGNSFSAPLRILVSAELGCLFLKFWVFGLTCPVVAATGIAALGVMALSRPRRRSELVPGQLAPARRIEADETSGIENDEDCAEIVKNRRDDRVNRARSC